MALANLIPTLYDKIGTLAEKAGLKLMAHENLPDSALSFPYKCNGYAADSHYLQTLERNLELHKKFLTDNGIPLDSNTPVMGLTYNQLNEMVRQVKSCFSNSSNIISDGTNSAMSNGAGSEPNIGLYIALGIGIAAGVGGLAYYLKTRSKKTEKTSQ